MKIEDCRLTDWRLVGRNCSVLHFRRAKPSINPLITPGLHNAMARVVNPKAIALQERTRKFATAIIEFCKPLLGNPAARSIAEQLTDSAGSTDSNYRAACRARSPIEFIAKIGVAAEEADESKGWLQLLVAANLANIEDARNLIQEANELTAILVASRKTAVRRQQERERLRLQLKPSKSRRRST